MILQNWCKITVMYAFVLKDLIHETYSFDFENVFRFSETLINHANVALNELSFIQWRY